jgi:heme/copper-type cytochrome/quinol oxidase subunit 3
MSRKAALIGFLLLQVIAVALAVMAIQPYLGNDPITGQQIWSGRGFSNISSNFRSGSQVVLATPFQWNGPLLWATLLMVAAGASAVASMFVFNRGSIWVAVGLAVVALLLGAGGNWFIADQWLSGDTGFPQGFQNVYMLYELNQKFNIQFFIGFVLLALSIVAIIAGFASKSRPFGFHVVALNWAVVATTWVVTYIALYLAPALAAGAQA